MGFSKYNIEKLNGKNFPIWQTKLRLALMREGAWNVVNGKLKKLDSDDTKIQQWENLNDKALSLLGLSLDDEVIYQFGFNLAAPQLWDKLEHLFGNKIINSKSLSQAGVLQTPNEGRCVANGTFESHGVPRHPTCCFAGPYRGR